MIYAVLAPVCLGALFALCMAWRLEPRWLDDALFIERVMRDYREETEGILWTWCQNCSAIIQAGSLYCARCANDNLGESIKAMFFGANAGGEIDLRGAIATRDLLDALDEINSISQMRQRTELTDAERSHEAVPEREPLLMMG